MRKMINRFLWLLLPVFLLLPVTAAYATDQPILSTPELTVETEDAVRASGNSVSILEGGTYTLSVSGVSGTVTWSSSNTAAATVSSAGVVTGVKAGTATITASVGGTVQQTFTVYVRIADGMYYISSNGLRLGTSGLVADTTRVSLYSPSSAGFGQLSQLWKITYLSEGYYSIRPMYKLDMGLHATTNLVDITSVSTTDTLSSVALAHRWGIEYKNGSYIFKYTNSMGIVLYAVSASSGSAITISGYSSAASGFHWTIQKVSSVSNQVVLINTETGAYAVNSTHYIDPGETATLSDLGIAASFVSASSNDQSFTWTSSSSSNVTVNSAGAVTGMTPGGTATITATHYLNGTAYQAQYTVKVKPIPDGTYFVRNPASERYLQIDNDDSSNSYSTSGAAMEQWYYTGGSYQKWSIAFCGDGYYSIINSQSGLALSVPSGQTGSTNVNLVQETYYGYDRQKWSITQTDSGYYKIKPKSASSDLVMAVGSSDVSVVDGVKIQQRTYTNDTTYIDEWQLCSHIYIGISSDNYTGSSLHRNVDSYLYATLFYNELLDSAGGMPAAINHHYTKDAVHGASINDFSVNGAMSNDIDFMIYIGHGYSAYSTSGNYLHYYCTSAGISHTDDCENDSYNVYSQRVTFGSSESKLRWVWLYTCNFLHTQEDNNDNDSNTTNDHNYVTNAALVNMMDGAHIVMGYASRATLCDTMAVHFATYLQEGMPIYEAYLLAGYTGEASDEPVNHYQKILYIPQARYETIYSPMVRYNYDPSDVEIFKKNIHTQCVFE